MTRTLHSATPRELAAALRGTPSPMPGAARGLQPTLRQFAVVTGVDTTNTVLTLSLGGATPNTASDITGVHFLDSYNPRVGDTVVVEQAGTDLLVTGRVAAASSQTSAPAYRFLAERNGALPATVAGVQAVPVDLNSWGYGWFDRGNGGYRCPVWGNYRAIGRASVNFSAAGQRIIVMILLNGTEIIRGADLTVPSASYDGGPVMGSFPAQANDLIQLGIYCTTAGLTIANGGAICFLEVEFLGSYLP